MPFNGSGVFQRVRNWVADATAGVKIRADYHDAEDDGFAAGLTNCITKDGQTVVTQNIPFNSKRLTGLADPVNAQDASTKAYTDSNILTATTQLVPPGAVMDFARPTAPAGWLPCDGQSLSTTTYAALFAAIGYTWGGSGANFNAPNFGSRFRRHRDNSTLSGAVGNLQSPANKTHTHRILGTSGAADRSLDHLHHVVGTSQSMNRSNPHSHPFTAGVTGSTTGGGAFGISGAPSASNTGGTDINHEHGIDFMSQGVDRGIDHLHAMDFTSQGGSGDDANETRPYSATVLTCIKT
jgi:microcystin-dependent protein